MKEKYQPNTRVAVGYGLLPSNTATGQIYHILTIAAEVDNETHRVINACVTLVTPVSESWVTRNIVGNSLASEQDTEMFCRTVESGFVGNSRRAIVHAYRDMVQRYLEHVGLAEPPTWKEARQETTGIGPQE